MWLFERPAIWRAFGPLARRLVWVARGGPFARAPPVRVALGSLGRPTTQRGALEARAVGKSLAARGRAVGSIELAARRSLGGGKRIPRLGGGARESRTTRVPTNWDGCARRDSLGRPDSGTRASWGLDGATAPFCSGGGGVLVLAINGGSQGALFVCVRSPLDSRLTLVGVHVSFFMFT